ncbi:thioredoxin fold domain-containing protein [Aliifodinibius sp. S!AR15-10]|uniref:protein-disulfide reductase DsbD family protein n=1 Tax=Aliifodinibius sp. S!AR15-10 TaxID=2950437 RepID=UPI00285ED566|nr:cytochrome c biogenesis protein CcdA [Aliifodinibius sp. S!AR15-10]MDR8390560.1 thioredoxin fold domain-containing protein [Aliifodinibius sp. S!AR15-10]
MKRCLTFAMGIVLLVLSPFCIQAQMLDPVSFEVTQSPETVQAGEPFEITISTTIEGKWHLYSVNNDPDAGPYPTQFSSANPQLVVAGKVKESEPSIEYDPNFDTELGWHTSQATFTVPLAFKTDASGSTMIDLEVLYQVCDDKACLPPKKKSVTQAISISGVASQPYGGFSEAEGSGGTSGAPGNSPSDNANSESIEQGTNQPTTSGYTSGGFFSFIWIALTAGFAALLTPCVFPMIPLTVSFFSKQNEGNNKRAVGQALLFGVAIVATFTVLGALLAALIGASGANQFAANPWVNLFIGIVLIVFALSLLGMFELRLPYQLTNWLNRKSNESSGIMGVLFMALTISAVSFSCTAPFVGGVLAATTGGEWFYPIIGMAGFSAAFASPFVLFALFPRWLESLPKSGSWMNVVKVLLGFIELAAAFKFFSNADLVWQWGIVSRPLTIAAWITIFFLAGLYIIGTYSLKHENKPGQIGTGRLMLAIPFFLFSFYLIPGLLGASLGIWDAWLPPKQATDVSVVYSIAQTGGAKNSAEGDMEGWSDDYQASIEKAKQNGEPIFIDFTGYTCTNCRAMETNVFPLEEVQNRFAKMEKVRLYTDDGIDGPENQQFQFKLTGTVALPTYVIVDPNSGKVLDQLVGYADKDKFKKFLDNGLGRFTSQSESSAALVN